jgi:hypothetical protein
MGRNARDLFITFSNWSTAGRGEKRWGRDLFITFSNWVDGGKGCLCRAYINTRSRNLADQGPSNMHVYYYPRGIEAASSLPDIILQRNLQ